MTAPALHPRLRALLLEGGAIVTALYALLYATYAYHSKGALSASGVADLANNAAPLMIAAAGGALVILLRGFDLSVAGVISLSNVLLAVCPMEGPGGALAGLAMVVGVGALVGLVNGVLVAYVGLQSVAATLSTMIATQGIALVLLDAPGGAVSDWISNTMTDVVAGVIPVSGLVVLVVVGAWLLLKRTNVGIALYAVGRDETAAGLSGIDVRRAKCIAFICAGVLYGIAGYMLSAQTASGNPNAGNSMLLLVFASIALGGTSFSGGQGGLVGSVVGAATLMLLQKVLFSSGVQSFYIGLVQGMVMIMAVAFANLLARLVTSEHAK